MPPERKPTSGLETNIVPGNKPAPGNVRTDPPEPVPPDSLPPRDEGRAKLAVGGGLTPKIDGGVEQHPIHDDDQEDATSSDYERELDRLDQAARR